jgi:hypothetical protein
LSLIGIVAGCDPSRLQAATGDAVIGVDVAAQECGVLVVDGVIQSHAPQITIKRLLGDVVVTKYQWISEGDNIGAYL